MRQIPLTENLKDTKDRKRTNQIEGFVTLPSWEK